MCITIQVFEAYCYFIGFLPVYCDQCSYSRKGTRSAVFLSPVFNPSGYKFPLTCVLLPNRVREPQLLFHKYSPVIALLTAAVESRAKLILSQMLASAKRVQLFCSRFKVQNKERKVRGTGRLTDSSLHSLPPTQQPYPVLDQNHTNSTLGRAFLPPQFTALHKAAIFQTPHNFLKK